MEAFFRIRRLQDNRHKLTGASIICSTIGALAGYYLQFDQRATIHHTIMADAAAVTLIVMLLGGLSFAILGGIAHFLAGEMTDSS